MGQSPMVAICTHRGFNIEDSLLMKRQACMTRTERNLKSYMKNLKQRAKQGKQ